MAIRVLRSIRVVGNVAYVPLSQGREALIDATDLPLVEGFNWSLCQPGTIPYAVRNIRLESGKQRPLRMHRAILGVPDGVIVDHVNCDGLDNRRANLRVATLAQNAQNSRRRKRTASGLKGVYWNKLGRKWQAEIMADGRTYYLGLFDAPEAAHAAYVEAAKRLHGEFARVA
jgi:hypothetical protein